MYLHCVEFSDIRIQGDNRLQQQVWVFMLAFVLLYDFGVHLHMPLVPVIGM